MNFLHGNCILFQNDIILNVELGTKSLLFTINSSVLRISWSVFSPPLTSECYLPSPTLSTQWNKCLQHFPFSWPPPPAPAPVIKSSSTSLSAQSVAVTATTLPAQHSRNAIIIITPIRGRAGVCGTFSSYFPAL